MVTGDLTLSGKSTMQYGDDLLQNFALETYINLLSNSTTTNLFFLRK